MMHCSVIPAKAGTSGREVSAGLPEVPAFAGMTSQSASKIASTGSSNNLAIRKASGRLGS